MDARRSVAPRRPHGSGVVRRIRAGARPRAGRRAVTSPLTFPSAEWVAAYGTAINASETYRAASLNWTFGAVALVVAAQPAIGLAEPLAIWLDLDRGVCREARLVPAGEAQGAPFILTAQYDRWK